MGLVLCSKATGKPLWSPVTWGHSGASAVMQPDGNLVVHGPDGRALWATGTYTSVPDGHLVVQHDDNLVLYVTDTGAAWSSGTYGQS